MSDCCKCSTRWEIEETRWTVYGYGLSDGAQYLGPKLNLADPNTPPVGCAPGTWKFIGEKNNRIFYKRIEKLYDRIVKRELVEPPYSNGDCINTSGGNLISNTLLSEDSQDYGLEKITTRVPNDYSAGSYWKYSNCNTIAIGWEEFKYRKEVYNRIENFSSKCREII